jgi:tetratricopeptide (TPR) repeat protein
VEDVKRIAAFLSVVSVVSLTSCSSTTESASDGNSSNTSASAAHNDSAALQEAIKEIRDPGKSKEEQALGAYQIGVAARGKGLLGISRENLDLAVELAPDTQTARDATDYKLTHLPLKPVSQDIEDKCAHAHNLLVEGSLDEASLKFKELSTEAPDFEFPYIYMGVIEIKRGNRTGAKELFKHALNINPKNSNASGWLAKLEAKEIKDVVQSPGSAQASGSTRSGSAEPGIK